MLTELQLENYRCFERHRIPLRPTTIIVGRNNAGKSTVAEALRLVSIVVERYQSLAYHRPPSWSDLPRWHMGVRPSLRGMGLDFTSLFYRYGGPPARVAAVFDSGHTVTVFIRSEEEIHAVIADERGQPVRTKAQAQHVILPAVSILPQVAPVAHDEQVLTPRYVLATMSSALAPLHFRNELHWRSDLFEAFMSLSESSWPGLQIKELSLQVGAREQTLSLLIRDGDFAAEIAAMGHGLQMWLQVMWFLTRCAGHQTVILDEPDVYMHADLQRRLIRLVRPRHRQVIIATHSVEILAQVEPEEVLVLDRTRDASEPANSLPGVQRVIDQMGGIHNVQIARLWSSRRFLLLEGHDLGLLKHFHATLYPGSEEPLDGLPHMSIGGWGNWAYAVASKMVLQNTAGEVIRAYCILDRDYHPEDEIAKRHEDALKRGVDLHVWTRKEIENYLLVPDAISRVVTSSPDLRGRAPNSGEVASEIARVADALKDTVADACTSDHFATDRSDLKAALEAGRKRVEHAWRTWEGKLGVIPGKMVLSRLSEWTQATFGVALSATRIARELTPAEIGPEVKAVLSAIEHNQPFRAATAAPSD